MGDGRASQRTPSSNTTGDVTAEPKPQAEPTPTSKSLGTTGTCTTSPSTEYCDLSHIIIMLYYKDKLSPNHLQEVPRCNFIF